MIPEMSARKIKARILALMVVLFFSGLAFGYTVKINGTDTFFEYRRTITIQSSQVVGGPHSNFPMLFDSTKVNSGLRDDLKTQTYGGKVRNANGDDIVFATGNGIEILKHEIEYYDEQTGDHIAWVRIESINNGTVFYLYYGSDDSITYPANFTTDVWSNGYVGVWHLDESPNDGVAGHDDSTLNNNDGTPQNFQDAGGGSTDATGRIDGADNFAGDNDYVDIPYADSLDITTDKITIDAWVNFNADFDSSATQDQTLIDGGGKIEYWWEDSDGKLHLSLNTGGWLGLVSVKNSWSVGVWYHLVGVYNGTNRFLYIDSVEDNSQGDSGNLNSSVFGIHISNPSAGTNEGPFNGIIDEVRISDTPHSAGWIKTEHNNQNAPGSFYSISGPTLVELSYFRAKALNSAVLLEWKTETELDNAGFNVWRSEEKDGEYVKINLYFIPAEGEAGFGAEYSFTDYDVTNGMIYYYKLEDVDLYGKSSFHGPVPAVPHDVILIWLPEDEILLSDAALFNWSSSQKHCFKVEISPSPSFLNSETLSFPEKGWITVNSLWLEPEDLEFILSKVRESGGQLFWRVKVRSPDGREVFSDWKRFTIVRPKVPEE